MVEYSIVGRAPYILDLHGTPGGCDVGSEHFVEGGFG